MEEETLATELESKFVRLQAACDELSDVLSRELWTVIHQLESGNREWVIMKLKHMIDAVEVFSGPLDAEEEDQEE